MKIYEVGKGNIMFNIFLKLNHFSFQGFIRGIIFLNKHKLSKLIGANIIIKRGVVELLTKTLQLFVIDLIQMVIQMTYVIQYKVFQINRFIFVNNLPGNFIKVMFVKLL